MLRAFQNDGAPEPAGQGDEEQPACGNHDGGVLRFGPDGKLYLLFGDNGRRGQLQNCRAGQAGVNVQKIFAYGLRNSFGMDFDPISGALWEKENGDDSFSELNRADAGFNSGWVQIMGPPERIDQYKAIETSLENDPCLASPYFGLQQLRWSPESIANSPGDALARLFVLPGSHYSAPEFS